MPSPPRYTYEASVGASILLSPYNDFELYVEDARQVNLYRNLMKAAAGGIPKSWFPIPLEGRNSVIRRAREMENRIDRRRLFLIDGDIPFIRGEPTPKVKNLYAIHAYCIENVTLEPDAIIEVAIDANGTLPPLKVLTESNYSDLETLFSNTFLPMFILYAIARKLAEEETTVSLSWARFVDAKNCSVIREDQIRITYQRIIRACVSRHGWKKFIKEKKKIRAGIRARNLAWMHIISGKDYAIPPLHSNLVKLGYRGTQEHLSRNLARHCEFLVDPSLRRRLRRLFGLSR